MTPKEESKPDVKNMNKYHKNSLLKNESTVEEVEWKKRNITPDPVEATNKAGQQLLNTRTQKEALLFQNYESNKKQKKKKMKNDKCRTITRKTSSKKT